MTQGGLRQMLNLESLFYGVKALVIGLPLVLILSYLLHLAMGVSIEFAYDTPVMSMLISVAVVMLLTFGTMRYSARKLGGGSIVETLKNANI